MATRDRFEEIEDYHFAVNKFVYEGNTESKLRDLLKERGASETQTNQIITTIYENHVGVRILEVKKHLRLFNFLVDFSAIILIIFIIYYVSKLFLVTDDLIDIMIFSVLIIPFLYYFIMEYTLSKTVGKLITKTIVVTEKGVKPTFIKILLRGLCRYYIPSFVSIINQDRPFHDSFSSTCVVSEKRLLNYLKNHA